MDALNKVESEENVIRAYGLPHNVLCVKRFLSEQQQIDLVQLSNDVHPLTVLQTSPFPQHTPWIYHNWPTKFMQKEEAEMKMKGDEQQKEKQMESLLSLGGILGKMIISIAQSAREQNEKKEKDKEAQKAYKPAAIYGILYPSRGFLEAHTDAHQGWIVSLSIGASAHFWYSADQIKKHRINIRSGDVLVFPGYRLMHGIDSVDQNAPKFWKEMQAKRIVPQQFARYCLQFRHPLN